MSNNFKKIFLSVAMTGFIFNSATVLADNGGHIFPGISEPCQYLWLVNDEENSNECIDVPVTLDEVKVVFNIDNAVTSWSDGETPVALRHMALLGKVMKHRIAEGDIKKDDVAIVGIFHGEAMSKEKWPFRTDLPGGGMPPKVKEWVDTIFKLKKFAGINIQLEVCGVTLKGMQLKKAAAYPNAPLLDEGDIYSNDNGRIYVNQGAIGRMIELQQHGFVYLQEE